MVSHRHDPCPLNHPHSQPELIPTLSCTMSKSSGNEVHILASLRIKPVAKAANYREWRLAVVDILCEKDYLDIVTGKPIRPNDTESTTGEMGSTATTSSSAMTATAKKPAEITEATPKWEVKCNKACCILGPLLDAAHRELDAEVRDPRELWQKLEKRYAGKDQARFRLLREVLSKVESHDDNLIDYMTSLEKLFNKLAAPGEVQTEKHKKYLLLSKLALVHHPFRTSTWNDSKYNDFTYDDICNRLLLEHQLLMCGDAETEATNPFYAGKGKRRENGKKGWKPKAEGSSTSTRSGERSVSKDSCFHCKEKGHWANKCPKKRQDTTRSGNPNSNRRDRGQNQGTGSSATINSSPQAWKAMDQTSAMIAEAKWLLDSGATPHMTSNCTQFQDIAPVRKSISVANGATMMAEGEGDVKWNLVVNGAKNKVILRKVLYVPEMGSSGLVSVRCIQAAGGVVSFAGNAVSITHGETLHAIAKLQHNAYILQTAEPIVANTTVSVVAQQAKVNTKQGTFLE